ncbi:hypothetical protein BSFP_052280 [Burkholderia stabilis]|uniref:Uncharacterized protein n=1 Tax=Burkholderia stabilis TaxID=95485 RepID=A0A1Y1BR53_9BURK|nr:hypothetical protein BSFP_052280 [Burkholderia stabilis]
MRLPVVKNRQHMFGEFFDDLAHGAIRSVMPRSARPRRDATRCDARLSRSVLWNSVR